MFGHGGGGWEAAVALGACDVSGPVRLLVALQGSRRLEVAVADLAVVVEAGGEEVLAPAVVVAEHPLAGVAGRVLLLLMLLQLVLEVGPVGAELARVHLRAPPCTRPTSVHQRTRPATSTLPHQEPRFPNTRSTKPNNNNVVPKKKKTQQQQQEQSERIQFEETQGVDAEPAETPTKN
jgi:hypothetical protein